MRCKKHLPDLTSTIGVCASCLRERLQPLLAAQAQAQAQSERSTNYEADNNHRRRKPKPKTKPEPEENENPNDNPPPLNFPRSVSPYVTHRKSDCERHRDRLFYGTPQVSAAACDGGVTSEKRRHGGRFWILSNLFRPRSNKTENSCEEQSSSASPPSTATTSWFSTILPASRHHHHGGGIERRRCRGADRGLSPASAAENYAADEARDRSDSGNSSESSPGKANQTPATANRRSRLGSTAKGITSMAFCLSPLVRASPNRHWSHHHNHNHKGLAQELGAAGGGAHHISNAASFCANRSRKLADFGRGSHNR